MEKKKILIITSSIDETASYVIDKHSNLAMFFRVDVDKFDEYLFVIENDGWCIKSKVFNITSDEIYSIYYRKPMLPNLDEYEPQYHVMIQRDIIAVVNGIADSFHKKVLTKPSILMQTENKVYQLMYAGSNGWIIPKSYIGNDGRTCKEYENTVSIIKPLTTGKIYGSKGCELYQTNIFEGIREGICLTPIYLQEYIHKAYEVRVTIVENNVYAVRIDTENKIDWRVDYSNHKYTKIICPNEVLEKCYKLMEDFSLNFGAFDFVVTSKEEWVFLEINPNGQWLWLEQALQLDISKNIVEYLVL